jgi:hypothetical protein
MPHNTTADEPEKPAVKTGTLLHIPPARFERNEGPYDLKATMSGTWNATALELRVRTMGHKSFDTVPFRRSNSNSFVARIDDKLVRPPGVEYYIRSKSPAGTFQSRFATAKQPHLVLVAQNTADKQLKARLERHGGRRTDISTTFKFLNFGQTRQSLEDSQTGTAMRMLPDWMNELETSVTYNFLHQGIYSIEFGYGMLGGALGANTPALAAYQAPNASDNLLETSQPQRPGVYYGFGTIYWEFGDYFALEPKVIMGASHHGFEGGGGLLARIGTVRGTHFDIAFEGISHVGYRFITEFQWATLKYFHMSLKNEVSTYPYNGRLGFLPSFNATLLLDFLEISTMVGYGVRKGFEEGGFCAGGGLTIRLSSLTKDE